LSRSIRFALKELTRVRGSGLGTTTVWPCAAVVQLGKMSLHERGGGGGGGFLEGGERGDVDGGEGTPGLVVMDWVSAVNVAPFISRKEEKLSVCTDGLPFFKMGRKEIRKRGGGGMAGKKRV